MKTKTYQTNWTQFFKIN